MVQHGLGAAQTAHLHRDQLAVLHRVRASVGHPVGDAQLARHQRVRVLRAVSAVYSERERGHPEGFSVRNPPQAVLAGGGHHERPVQQPNEAGQGGAVHANQWQPRRPTRNDGPRHDPAPLEQHADAVAQLPAEPAATDAPTAAAPPSAAPSLFARALDGRFHRFRGRHGTGHDAAAAAGRPEPQLQAIEALANDRWTHCSRLTFFFVNILPDLNPKVDT
uniref:(northern house mosquito) hypothetical protein n=1 Tax=Culex pipiens TaxID=7175 RepID=A0A8D8FPM7_CULPI